MFIGISLAYYTAFCILLSLRWKVKQESLFVGFSVLLLLVAVYYTNSTFEIIDEKSASFISYEMYHTGSQIRAFVLQYYMVYLPIAMFDFEYAAHALNLALHGFTVLLVYQFLFKVRLHWSFLLVLCFPGFYHYTIFGLRDPLLNILSAIVILAVIHLRHRGFTIVICICAFLSLYIRPEFSVILVGLLCVKFFLDGTRRQRVLIVFLGLVGFYFSLLVLPLALGIESTSDVSTNLQRISDFNLLRHDRRLGDAGGGSHILGGALFSYPFFIRYPIQVVASFIAPLPFELRGGVDLLAFIESIIFTGVAILAFKHRKSSIESQFLFWAGMIYMMLQAFFAINYGNVLRMRYPCYIFFVSAVVISVHPNWRLTRQAIQIRS